MSSVQRGAGNSPRPSSLPTPRNSDAADHLLYRWLGILQCPQCCGHFAISGHGAQRALQCTKCATIYTFAYEIPCLLKPERVAALHAYCTKYDRLRLQEGWASTQPEFYARLPFEDRTGKHVGEWQLRAQSWRQLQAWIKKEFGDERRRILDAGAGSGWMSRLLAASHEVLATDLNVGPHGLNAQAARGFMAVQAELEQLPLATHSFDLVIANASAHYAQNVLGFFAEAARVLRPGGHLVIMDSPVYRDRAALHAAHERTQAYYAQNGVPELAENYSALARELFMKPSAFNFTCLRRDFSQSAWLKKMLREKLGKESAARFPLWIGARMPTPEDRWRPDRIRAGALLIHDHKLLTYFFDGPQGSFWRIPGGGVETGETPAQAAVRELREEMNLEITLQQALGPFHLSNRDQWYFLAAADPARLPQDHAPALEEHCTVQWLPLAHLAQFDIRPFAVKWELVEYFSKLESR